MPITQLAGASRCPNGNNPFEGLDPHPTRPRYRAPRTCLSCSPWARRFGILLCLCPAPCGSASRFNTNTCVSVSHVLSFVRCPLSFVFCPLGITNDNVTNGIVARRT